MNQAICIPDISFLNSYLFFLLKVLFVNGAIDPWHALSFTTNIPSYLKAIYMQGKSFVNTTTALKRSCMAEKYIVLAMYIIVSNSTIFAVVFFAFCCSYFTKSSQFSFQFLGKRNYALSVSIQHCYVLA